MQDISVKTEVLVKKQQAEVNDILKNKEKMLSFKDSNGNWITRRFLFSKWTLREGGITLMSSLLQN